MQVAAPDALLAIVVGGEVQAVADRLFVADAARQRSLIVAALSRLWLANSETLGADDERPSGKLSDRAVTVCAFCASGAL